MSNTRDLVKKRAYDREWRRRNRAKRATYNHDWHQDNRQRVTAYYRAYREKHREKLQAQKRDGYYRREYGLSLEAKQALLESQHHSCALCGGGPLDVHRAHTDHCHDSGTVRALLCATCNTGLGHFKDDPALLERAAAYIRSYK